MKKSLCISNILCLVIVFLGLMVFLLYDDYNTISGLITGELRVTIRNQSNYFYNVILILNKSVVYTQLPLSFIFYVSNITNGFLNISIVNTNYTNFINLSKHKSLINKTVISDIYEINSNFTFDNATVVFKYDDSKLETSEESLLKIYYFNITSDDWQEIPSYVDLESNEIHGFLTHFSLFSIFGSTNSNKESFLNSLGLKRFNKTSLGFRVFPNIITASLLQDQEKSFELKLENLENKKINISIELHGLNELGRVNESSFIIYSSEIKKINFNLFASNKLNSGIYVGKIIFKGDSIIKIVDVLVEIKDTKPIFQFNLSVLSDFKKLFAKDKLKVFINLQNIDFIKPIDVILTTQIIDYQNTLLFTSSKELLNLKNSFSKIEELELPFMPAGKYLLISQIFYNNRSIEAYDKFEIIERKKTQVELKKLKSEDTFPIESLIVIILVLIIFLVILFYNLKKSRKLNKNLKR